MLVCVSLVEMEHDAAAKEGKTSPRKLQNLTELAHAHINTNTLNKHHF